MRSLDAQRGGIVMMLLFWIVLLGAGTWLIDGGFTKLSTPNAHVVNASPDGAPVTLKRNRSGHFEAPGEINGEPVTFLLDTGATYVNVPQELAARLALVPGRSAWFNTANGRVQGNLTELDEVVLGGLRAQSVQGSISPGMEHDTVLLGMSFLNLFAIEMADGEMRLRLPAP
ncbi:retropepsin-like aspartic protease family protein [Vreelandella malpeensis]|uniref:TIGR02281 family clan AA aspartic protease n=1 Tax=Vreelandella malpeensis TaxID=1172368 RepID=A0ABS8DP97_9GAMM|nr:TIGR02281 family clan AA aspartic protease [Halomonas malpeensis]MCB8888099.1 TIGR02281 family clan AA aspartic protease [Halomonas malpeensis]